MLPQIGMMLFQNGKLVDTGTRIPLAAGRCRSGQCHGKRFIHAPAAPHARESQSHR